MLSDLKIRIKIFGLQAFYMLLIMIVGVTGVVGMARIKADFKSANENHTAALVELAGVLDDIHQIQNLVAAAASNRQELDPVLLTSRIADLESERARYWLDYVATRIGPEEQAIVGRNERAWNAYRAAMHPGLGAPVMVASLQDVALPVPKVRLDDASHNLEVANDTVRQLIKFQGGTANTEYAAANALFMKLGIFELFVICAGLGLAGLLMFWDFVRLNRSPLSTGVQPNLLA